VACNTGLSSCLWRGCSCCCQMALPLLSKAPKHGEIDLAKHGKGVLTRSCIRCCAMPCCAVPCHDCRTLCCNSREMSWLSLTVISAGSTTSISTMYLHNTTPYACCG
jgi:hypothetical protein